MGENTMRSLFLCLGLLAATPVWCEDIVDVLRRSQDLRLASLSTASADSTRATTVRADFTRLVHALPGDTPEIELRVIRGPVMAETLHGMIVVANESLADLPEAARRFILAHELGHVMQGHWVQMAQVYQKWIPGEVTQTHTDAIAASLGEDASALARRQEFEADAFAAHLLHSLGVAPPDVLTAFVQMGPSPDTPTHPGARRRLASLRTLQPPAFTP